jgi:hypothetical protein
MSSLPPRLCPTGLDGVVGVTAGECGGVPDAGSGGVAAGLKEKSGNAETDFCRSPGVDPRRLLGYICIDIGRALGAGVESVEEASEAR